MLNRNRRTKILIEGKETLAQRLAEQIRKQYDVRELEEANEGLVMVRMNETARNTIFNFGEVLVTEAKVMIGDVIGIGIVKGHRSDLATNLAVIDAACTAKLSETAAWDSLLIEEESNLRLRAIEKSASIMKTRVQFETMDVESGGMKL